MEIVDEELIIAPFKNELARIIFIKDLSAVEEAVRLGGELARAIRIFGI
jgi:hypothetical protein